MLMILFSLTVIWWVYPKPGLLPEWRQRVTRLLKEHGDVEVSKVVISQFYGGMRGIKCLTTDISYLDPMEGIRFRGYTIPEVLEKLPKAPGAEIPYVEQVIFLQMMKYRK